MDWEKIGKKKFDDMIQRMPLFHRQIAKEVVERKAMENAETRGAQMVEEVDIVSAFFSEVPKAFFSLMVKLMDDVGFDHEHVG